MSPHYRNAQTNHATGVDERTSVCQVGSATTTNMVTWGTTVAGGGREGRTEQPGIKDGIVLFLCIVRSSRQQP